MLIRTATLDDLPAIAALEKIIEDPRVAASFEVLSGRLRLFPEGFFAAISEQRVVGYLESIRWDGPAFEKFADIKQYERMHLPLGSVLYIAFLAVDPEYRKHGIASRLMQAAESMAAALSLQSIQLVALPKLVDFYGKMGFRQVRTLPQFLESSAGELMQKDLNAQQPA